MINTVTISCDEYDELRDLKNNHSVEIEKATKTIEKLDADIEGLIDGSKAFRVLEIRYAPLNPDNVCKYMRLNSTLNDSDIGKIYYLCNRLNSNVKEHKNHDDYRSHMYYMDYETGETELLSLTTELCNIEDVGDFDIVVQINKLNNKLLNTEKELVDTLHTLEAIRQKKTWFQKLFRS